MNKMMIIGNVTNAPELAQSKSGTAYSKMSVAVNTFVKGEKKTTFFNVLTFGKTAENVQKYVAKGSKVFAEGEISVSAYQAQDGSPKASLNLMAEKIEFLSEKKKQEAEADGFITLDSSDIPF